MSQTSRPRLWPLVLAPLLSSLVPACTLIASAELPDEDWVSSVLLLVFGTVPACGAGVAFAHAGAGGARVVRPLIPYAAFALVFALATWALVLWQVAYDDLFAGYLYAIPALPVLALAGCYGVLSRVSSRQP